MTIKEQLEELLKDIPKTYNMVSAYSSVNVKDLEEAVDRFKYVPNYQDLLKENNKQQKEIEKLNNIINEFEQWIKDSKRETLMGLGTINRIFFADELLNKLKEIKGENNG